VDSESIRLTRTVVKGGCAAKLPAGELRKVLSGLEMPRRPELRVGTETLDDACLYDLGGGLQLVQTLDFFTPIVDDPSDFGAIAAANAISDIYAMGGAPRIALTILAFPAASLPTSLLRPLMEGAIAKIREADACLAGGHTIDDDTLKLGFSVTGFVKESEAWTNAGAREGDVLILTKPIGTGCITTALKLDEAPADSIRAAIDSMKTLNNARAALDAANVRVNAATDITGFGLAGHALQMAQASGVTFVIGMGVVPTLEGAVKLLEDEYLNRAHRTNRDYVKNEVEFGTDLPEVLRWLACDPQTSGGLLLSVPETQADAALRALRTRFSAASIIGSVAKKADNPLVLRS
jgi:selenide,water dikinase